MLWHRLAAMMLATLVAAGPSAQAIAATDSRQVPTETITPPVGDDEDGMPARIGPVPDSPDEPDADTSASDEPVATVEYDFSKLPAPVKRLREQLLAAAKTGDINALKPIIDAGAHPPNLGTDKSNQLGPVDYLKSVSGDPEGREILAILSEVLEAGYVHVDVGTPEELYVWPYFARYPIDKLTPPQMVELFRLLTSTDFEEMKTYGAYLFYRVGISPDGTWSEFQAGD